MTLSEALSTMKPYRRVGDACWRSPIGANDQFTMLGSDAIATDYEIEEPSVSVTITQLRVAILRAVPRAIPTATDKQIDSICRELGL